MKIRLAITGDDYEKIKEELNEHGIETDDNAELILCKANGFDDKLIVKEKTTNEHVVVPFDDIVYIDSYGHSVEVHTKDNTYQSNERLYKVLQSLDNKFLRISNSVIVSKKHIVKISPTLSMKFILTMSNADRVDVTRSYYYAFKEAFNI